MGSVLHPASAFDFLSGGGMMGALIRDFEWSAHPLGPAHAWPQSLKTAVSLILSSQHPMWIGWGPERTFLYNDAYLHVLGMAKHPWALGRPASEVWAEIWDVCGPLAEKVFAEAQASFVDDVRLFMNRGGFLEETYYSFSYSPIRDESGRVAGLFCPSNDVTPKVLGARRLRTLSELAANALAQKSTRSACASAGETLAKNRDDVPFALLYLVEDGGASAALEQAVGIPLGGAMAPVRIELADPAAVWPLGNVLRTARSEKAPLPQGGIALRGPADQLVAEALVLPVASGAHELPVGVLIAGVNPTRKVDADYQTFYELVAGNIATAIQNARAAEYERKRADMLAEIDRAKTIFFSNVSHEFRTPLTLLLSPLEEAIARGEGPETRDLLHVAHRNGLRLQKLVNALLDFSRIEAGRAQACYVPTDLAALTADLTSSFQAACDKAGLRLEIECPTLPEPAFVDQEMWEKIVLNLVSNAFKYTFSGRIRVALEGRNGFAILTVEDTGTGIPAEELPRIFDRFHRVEHARGRTQEGTGIGLALVNELTKLHGGAVYVQSEVGRGTVFTVEIPFGKTHLPQEQVARPRELASTALGPDNFVQEAIRWLPGESGSMAPSRPVAGGRPRLLLADDNADMRDYVRRLLGQSYDVVCAPDGQAALELAREQRPDLILTDVMMPGLDGFALLRALREDPRTRDAPIVVLSAKAGEEARIEGLEAGADDYVTKPFSAKELLARVEGILKLHRARREAREQVERYALRLQTALDAARMTTWEWDLASGEVVHSSNAGELWGQSVTHEAAAGWAAIHPDDVPQLRRLVEDAIERRGDYRAEARFVRPDTGEPRWMRIHGSVMTNGEGDPVKIIGVMLDITDRKQAEEELQANIEEALRFNRIAVGREMRLIELKEEVNELCRQLGQGRRYPLSFQHAEQQQSHS